MQRRLIAENVYDGNICLSTQIKLPYMFKLSVFGIFICYCFESCTPLVSSSQFSSVQFARNNEVLSACTSGPRHSN